MERYVAGQSDTWPWRWIIIRARQHLPSAVKRGDYSYTRYHCYTVLSAVRYGNEVCTYGCLLWFLRPTSSRFVACSWLKRLRFVALVAIVHFLCRSAKTRNFYKFIQQERRVIIATFYSSSSICSVIYYSLLERLDFRFQPEAKISSIIYYSNTKSGSTVLIYFSILIKERRKEESLFLPSHTK